MYVGSLGSRALRASLVLSLVLCAAGAAQGEIVRLVTYLTTTNEVIVPPPVPGNAEGICVFTIDTDANTVDYYLQYGELSSPEAVSHIHGPSTPDTLGDILVTLPEGNPKFGRVVYEEANETDYVSGGMYINVHSEMNPLGELRGQMTDMVAILEGAQETTFNQSVNVGVGFFNIDREANLVSYYIRDSVPDPLETAAGIHGFATHGADAPVLHTLPTVSPKIGNWIYDEEQEESILDGLTYVNIQTEAFPAGEIRGQITSNLVFLDPSQENPATTGADGAFAMGMYSFDPASRTLGYRIRYQSLSSEETAAHIHGFAHAGANAGVLHTLPLGPLKVGFADLSSQPEFVLSRLYVNIHTANNPSGEIRGQIRATPGVAVPVNLSTRGFVGPVETGEAMIGGFIVSGTAGRRVLIGGIGPDLANFGVTGVLANPSLLLFRGSTMLASNNDWTASADRDRIAATGFAPNNDLEAAILADLEPGEYTAIVFGEGEGTARTGVGLVQAFDLGPAGGEGASEDGRLSNLSTRLAVGTGDRLMIGGFTVSATAAEARVLVRGLGPTLGQPPFDVPGAMADPEILLFRSEQSGPVQIGANTDWVESDDADAIEASGFAPAHPLEPAILATLPSGEYTAIVSGANGSEGVALVEVYQLDDEAAATSGGAIARKGACAMRK